MLGCNQARKSRETKSSDSIPADSVKKSSQTKTSDIISFEKKIDEYEDPERGEWQNPNLVLQKLGDLNGKTVADLGAGTGYFTFRMAEKAKKVIAIDIEQKFLDYIEDRKLELPPKYADVIETRLTMPDDPDLKPKEVDAVLMVNVYYYLKNRIAYMAKVKKGLKKTGILVLVDFKLGDMPVGPANNKVSVRQATSDLQKAGFKILEIDEKSLQYQYIIKAQ